MVAPLEAALGTATRVRPLSEASSAWVVSTCTGPQIRVPAGEEEGGKKKNNTYQETFVY